MPVTKYKNKSTHRTEKEAKRKLKEQKVTLKRKKHQLSVENKMVCHGYVQIGRGEIYIRRNFLL